MKEPVSKILQNSPPPPNGRRLHFYLFKKEAIERLAVYQIQEKSEKFYLFNQLDCLAAP